MNDLLLYGRGAWERILQLQALCDFSDRVQDVRGELNSHTVCNPIPLHFAFLLLLFILLLLVKGNNDTGP